MLAAYEILKEWKKECNYEKVIQFKYNFTTGVLTIYTCCPGYLIGKAGCYVDKYTKICEKEILGFKSVGFVETDYLEV